MFGTCPGRTGEVLRSEHSDEEWNSMFVLGLCRLGFFLNIPSMLEKVGFI